MITEKQNRPRKIIKCTYCLKEISRKNGQTKDHIIAQCFFSGWNPYQHITVPACEDCNSEKSRDDTYVRDMIVHDVSVSRNIKALHVFYSKVLKSIDAGKSEFAKDFVLNSATVDVISKNGTRIGEFPTLKFNEKRINQYFLRVVKGFHFNIYQEHIPDKYVVIARRISPWDIDDEVEELKRIGNFAGPIRLGKTEFAAWHSRTEEDRFYSLWVFVFYERFVFKVGCCDKDRLPGLINPKSDQKE